MKAERLKRLSILTEPFQKVVILITNRQASFLYLRHKVLLFVVFLKHFKPSKIFLHFLFFLLIQSLHVTSKGNLPEIRTTRFVVGLTLGSHLV